MLSEGMKQFLERFSFEPQQPGRKGAVGSAPEASPEDSWDSFYHRFKESLQGSCDQVFTQHRDRYQDRLTRHLKNFPDSRVLDAPCGRGEFLSLCSKIGFKVLGADKSQASITCVEDLGFRAKHLEVLPFLHGEMTETASLVGLRQVAQHCQPEYFYHAVIEAKRVLVPGGVLLIEIPSLNSLWTSARQQYMDPVQCRPIHPDYIAFLLRDVGFSKLEQSDYGEVPVQDRSQLSKSARGVLKEEFRTLESWLYGAPDVGFWAIKD